MCSHIFIHGGKMKKILMVLLLSPFAVFANNNDLGVHYTSWNIDDAGTIDGYGLNYSGLAGDNNVLVDFDLERVSGDGDDLNYNILSLGYAFGDANEGAFSIGLMRFDAEDEDSSDFQIGYGRRGGEGIDYHVGLVNTEDDTTFIVRLRGESGVTFSALLVDGDSIMNLGYSWRLGQ